MPDPRRLQVLSATKTRFQTITVSNGYNTNAGQRVYHGVPHTKDDGDPWIVMSTPEPADYVEAAQNHRHVEMPVMVEAAMKPADPANPLASAELLLGDLEKAIFLVDRTLGGLAKNVVSNRAGTRDREDGGELVGAFVEFRVVYTDKYGDPYGEPA